MSKKATEDDVVYEEDDEMNKNLGGQRSEGRRIKKKGSNKNKWFYIYFTPKRNNDKVNDELVSWVNL